jgi:small neutral amino acid transporter SnatA (MarC family)
MPEGEAGRARPYVLATGALLALGGIAALAGWSGPILETLEVSPETFRIAAGIVVAVAAVRTLVAARPAAEPEPDGWRAALWPTAFPRLFTPEVAALALSTGSQEGGWAALWAALAAMAATAALGAVRRTPTADRVLLRLGRLLALGMALTAVFLIVDGIRDV